MRLHCNHRCRDRPANPQPPTSAAALQPVCTATISTPVHRPNSASLHLIAALCVTIAITIATRASSCTAAAAIAIATATAAAVTAALATAPPSTTIAAPCLTTTADAASTLALTTALCEGYSPSSYATSIISISYGHASTAVSIHLFRCHYSPTPSHHNPADGDTWTC